MKTKFEISYSYRGSSFVFSKVLDLPFVPFYGLSLSDKNKDFEYRIDIKNEKNRLAMITYNIAEGSFSVYIREYWSEPIDSSSIEDIIRVLTGSGWKREDNVDIAALRELMEKDYKTTFDR